MNDETNLRKAQSVPKQRQQDDKVLRVSQIVREGVQHNEEPDQSSTFTKL